MTQEALAHAAGVTVGHLSTIERGHSNPTWGTVTRLADAMGSSIGDMGNLADRLKS
jgi:transcriptional regulator with XRE-family HTH domain